jgi:hypothetical protein
MDKVYGTCIPGTDLIRPVLLYLQKNLAHADLESREEIIF